MKRWLMNVRLEMALLMLISAFYTSASKAQIIKTYAGNGGKTLASASTRAEMLDIKNVVAATTDNNGNLYVADAGTNKIYYITPEGLVVYLSGNGTMGYTPDGTVAANATLNQPTAIAVDADGSVYFTEFGSNTVRKINKEGKLETVAGNATSGYTGNGGKATMASLQGPNGIAFDKAGNLYVSESENNCVRKIDKVTGVISLYAGNALGHGTGRGTYTGDGGKAVSAGFNQPGAIAFDSEGSLYVVDCFNHSIRKVTANGIIITFSGTGTAGYNGDSGSGHSMQLNYPSGLAFDASDNLYVSDFGNNRIRKISPKGVFITVAGNGTSMSSADGAEALLAGVPKPAFIAVDGQNNLFTGDNTYQRIKKISQNATIVVTARDTPIQGQGCILSGNAGSIGLQ